MALVTVSAQSKGQKIITQSDFAQSDDEFEQRLQEAVEASNDQFALHLQHAEVLELSTFAYAYALQVSEILNEMPSDGLGLLQLTASSSACSSSSSCEEREEYFNLRDDRLIIPKLYSDVDGHGQASLFQLTLQSQASFLLLFISFVLFYEGFIFVCSGVFSQRKRNREEYHLGFRVFVVEEGLLHNFTVCTCETLRDLL